MKRLTRCFLVLLAMVMSSPSVSHAEEVIYYRDWLRIKTAVSVIQLPALQRVVGQYQSNEDSRIVIRFPGGDLGNAWAEDLRDWLVSLGISSTDIELQPGSGIPQGIVLSAVAVP